MNKEKKIELVNSLISQLDAIESNDTEAMNKFLPRMDMILGNLFPIGSTKSQKYRESISTTIFFSDDPNPQVQTRTWNSGMSKFRAIFKTIKEDIQITDDETNNSFRSYNSRNIFIVHGHDNEMKLDVARFIESKGLNSIILDEQPSLGDTLIEKFERYSDVGYAVVCISPDDKGCKATKFPQDAKHRARQNVVLELGFFSGRLGRNRVLPLVRKHEEFEIPSDYPGIAYVEYLANGDWKHKIATELKALGYEIRD